MLRQTKKPLCFNPLPLIVMFVRINESGFVSKILYVATTFSETRKIYREAPKLATILKKMFHLIQNDLHVNIYPDKL